MEESLQRLIEWDENKNRINKVKHGVDFREASNEINFCTPCHQTRKGEIFMSIVRVLINEPSPPTVDELKNFKATALKELAKLNDSDDEILCDEDCPELTDEQLARLMPVHNHRNELRLTAQ